MVPPTSCLTSSTPNRIEFPITTWATHALGAIAAAANPAFSVDESLHRLNTTEPKLLVVHRSIFTGLEAAEFADLSEDRIVIIPTVTGPPPKATRLLKGRGYSKLLFNKSFSTEDEAKTRIAIRILIPIDLHVHRISSLLQFYLPMVPEGPRLPHTTWLSPPLTRSETLIFHRGCHEQ